jgi:2-methylcitrate dehydratase
MDDLISRRHAIAIAVAAGFGHLAPAPPVMAATAEPPPAAADRSLAQRLAAYVDALHYDVLDAATVETAKVHLIDALGCAIAALDEGPVRICRDVAATASGGVSTILGTTIRTTPDLAAFANGAAIRYYDLNDVYVGKQTGHPSDNISACLAVAESERSNGQDLITAIVTAYEITCRMLDLGDMIARGWDHPVCSLPAVALAAGKLMKLGTDKLTQAVNIAINDHISMNQTRVQVISDWKGIADAEAARNGVFATLLARGGLSGPAPIFEGRAGFFKQVSGTVEVDVDRFGGRDIPFRINDCGMKAYPVQIYSMTAIAAATAVAQQVGKLDRIKAIEIATTGRGYRTAGLDAEKWTPETKETADHSLPYVTARAMFDGDLTNDSYAPEKLRDPGIRAFMKKITVKEDPALTALMPKAIPNRVTAVLDDGQVVSHQADDLPGFIGRPMTRADVERKFHSNVSKRWSEAHIQAVLETLWTLERQTDLMRLMGQIAGKV